MERDDCADNSCQVGNRVATRCRLDLYTLRDGYERIFFLCDTDRSECSGTSQRSHVGNRVGDSKGNWKKEKKNVKPRDTVANAFLLLLQGHAGKTFVSLGGFQGTCDGGARRRLGVEHGFDVKGRDSVAEGVPGVSKKMKLVPMWPPSTSGTPCWRVQPPTRNVCRKGNGRWCTHRSDGASVCAQRVGAHILYPSSPRCVGGVLWTLQVTLQEKKRRKPKKKGC